MKRLLVENTIYHFNYVWFGRGWYSTQLVVWDVCGRKLFFCCIAITLLIRITEAMRAPEQVKKERLVWSLCYETQPILTTTSTGYNMRPGPFAWESGNPRYQLQRISHCITHLLLCHVMPLKKVVSPDELTSETTGRQLKYKLLLYKSALSFLVKRLWIKNE